MAISRVGQPSIFQEAGSNQPGVMKDVLPEKAAMTWLAMSFVYMTGTGAATVLEPQITTSAVAATQKVYGLCPDEAKGSTSPAPMLQPPQALFGLNHYPFDVRDRILEMNISNADATAANMGTANGVTYAGGGTGGVALFPGFQCGMLRPTSGAYLNYNFINVGFTANPILEIVGLAPNQSTADNSARVLCKVMPAAIQG